MLIYLVRHIYNAASISNKTLVVNLFLLSKNLLYLFVWFNRDRLSLVSEFTYRFLIQKISS